MKKLNTHYALSLVLFIFISSYSSAQRTLHVSPKAKKGGNGSLEKPFATLPEVKNKVSKMNGNMKEDIVVYLHEGTHTLREPIVFGPKDSGTNNFNVVYSAYDDDKVTISGGVKVVNWKKHKNNIYKAHLNRADKLRTLFINGKRGQMAVTEVPVAGVGNWGTFKVSGEESWAFGSGEAIDGITFKSEEVAQFKNPMDIELVQFNVWTEKILCTREIENLGETTVFKLQQPYGAIATNMALAGSINYNQKFIIRNAYELLDQPGEFYFDRATKTLYYYSNGEDISKAEVIAPTADGLLQFKGESQQNRVKNIKFQNLTFSYDHWQLMQVEDSYGFAGIQSLGLAVKFVPGGNWHPTKYNSTNVPRGSIHLENASNIIIENNRFLKLSSGTAINLVNDVKHCTINGNYYNDLLGNAVSLGHPQHYIIGDGEYFKPGIEGLCEYNVVSNNYIRNISLDFRQAEGITAFFVANTSIMHNDILGTPYGAISCGWWWGNSGIPPSKVARNNKISFNRAGKTHQVLDDGGIIYLLGEQPGTRVEGNYLFDGPRCIYPDDGSAYLTINENVVENGFLRDWWIYFWSQRCHDNVAFENHVTTNLLVNNGDNTTVSNTINYYSNRRLPFSGKAVEIRDKAGLEEPYKSMIPETEPEMISIHPKDYKMTSFMFH